MRKSKNIVDVIKVKISVGENFKVQILTVFFFHDTNGHHYPPLSPLARKCQVNDEVLQGADEELERHFARRIVLQVRQVSD